MCVECSTRVDRMNYCIRCLRTAEPTSSAPPENLARERILGVPLLIGAFLLTTAVFAVLGWLLALTRLWMGGGVSAE